LEPVAQRRTLLTADDYAKLPEDLRAELIDGELVMSPSPDPAHQRVVHRLVTALDRQLGPSSDDRVLFAPCDVLIDEHNVLQPDLLVLPEGTRLMPRPWRIPVPVFVIEVISSSTATRDRGVKMERYRARGIREAWIVDRDEKTIDVLDLMAGTSAVCGPGDSARSTAVPGFVIDAARLFEI
jgi:Uma2 family endonuclease